MKITVTSNSPNDNNGIRFLLSTDQGVPIIFQTCAEARHYLSVNGLTDAEIGKLIFHAECESVEEAEDWIHVCAEDYARDMIEGKTMNYSSMEWKHTGMQLMTCITFLRKRKEENDTR